MVARKTKALVVRKATELEPGDLMEFLPEGAYIKLFGFVLKKASAEDFSLNGALFVNPLEGGVVFYWVTSETEAAWNYSAVQTEMSARRMQFISRPHG